VKLRNRKIYYDRKQIQKNDHIKTVYIKSRFYEYYTLKRREINRVFNFKYSVPS
jgi:hypothetical protein